MTIRFTCATAAIVAFSLALMPEAICQTDERSRRGELTGSQTDGELLQPRRSAPRATMPKLLIVPGRSVGDLALGAGRAEIRHLLGRPLQQFRRSAGIREDVWQQDTWQHPAAGDTEKRDEIRIIFAGERAIQIKVTSPAYAMPDGFATRMTLARAFLHGRPLKLTAFRHGSGHEAYTAHYFDDVVRGIAYRVKATAPFNQSAAIDAIIVHRPGSPVMPDRGATPGKIDLYVPVVAGERATPPANPLPVVTPAPAPTLPAVPVLEPVGNGLPLRSHRATDGTSLRETDIVLTRGQFMFWVTAELPDRKRRHAVPKVEMILAAERPTPAWKNAGTIKLIYGKSRLTLPSVRETSKDSSGLYLTMLTVRLPYPTFADLARHKSFYLEIDGNRFEIAEAHTAGLRALGAELAKR